MFFSLVIFLVKVNREMLSIVRFRSIRTFLLFLGLVVFYLINEDLELE